jgi:hypothetical protein
MVKEVLRRSEISREPALMDILNSTIGVVFLGTPRKGSPGLASLAQTVRRTAGFVLRIDSNSTILRTLGVDSPELELCHESFITQWRERNFRVKTFQEAHGVTGINLGRLGEKVVPDYSSLLGDPRKRPEVISAHHMTMAQFYGSYDEGYRKVCGELRLIITMRKKDQTSGDEKRKEQIKGLEMEFPGIKGTLILSLSHDYDPITDIDTLRSILSEISSGLCTAKSVSSNKTSLQNRTRITLRQRPPHNILSKNSQQYSQRFSSNPSSKNAFESLHLLR